MQPRDSVHHETIRLVSLNFRLRKRMATELSIIGNLARLPPAFYIQGWIPRRNLCVMPEDETIERAHEDEREGKSPSTQAGEFVREEMEHIREGEHGARSPQQAIAIGLSKARRAGVKLPPPKRGKTSARTRKQAKRDLAKGRRGARKKPSRTRSRATKGALKRERRSAASRKALSRQARSAARRRSTRSRSAAAKKAARTRKHGSVGRWAAQRSTISDLGCAT